MNKLYLKFPSLEDKEKWIDYTNERNQSNLLPINYEKWLERRIKDHKGIDLDEGRVPSTVYFLMDEDRIIGTVSIRHNIDTKELSDYIGHIGYGIRQSERNKGYGTIMLNLALEKCLELGLENVMVSCKEDNIGSSKVIENNLGVLKDIRYISEEDSNFKIYWIDVKKALNMKDDIRKKL